MEAKKATTTTSGLSGGGGSKPRIAASSSLSTSSSAATTTTTTGRRQVPPKKATTAATAGATLTAAAAAATTTTTASKVQQLKRSATKPSASSSKPAQQTRQTVAATKTVASSSNNRLKDTNTAAVTVNNSHHLQQQQQQQQTVPVAASTVTTSSSTASQTSSTVAKIQQSTPKLTMAELEKIRERFAALPSDNNNNNNDNNSSSSEFPNAQLLRKANIVADCEWRGKAKPCDPVTGLVLPYPTPVAKDDVFQLEEYTQMDKIACSASKSEYTNLPLPQLVSQLLAQTDLVNSSQMAKFRTIFRWIGAQDLNRSGTMVKSTGDGEKKEDIEKLTVTDWLEAVSSGRHSYSRLLQEMCRFSGIHVCLVSGYAKSSDYEPGDAIDDARLSHEWAAVLIDGVWRLTDPRWAASYTEKSRSDWLLVEDNGNTTSGRKSLRGDEQDGEKTSQQRAPQCVQGGRVFYSYNEAWFLTDPDIMIHSHWPHDDQWQLLARPVTLAQFQQLAYLKPEFFDFKLEVTESSKKCVLEASDGELEFMLAQPRDAKYSFMYRLWIAASQVGLASPSASAAAGNAGDRLTFNGTTLDRFVFLQNVDGRLTCRIQFPVSARFKIEIFCRDLQQRRPAAATDRATAADRATRGLPAVSSFQLVCAYVIDALCPKRDVEALPENHRMEWGPGHDLEAAGLVAVSHKGGGEIVSGMGEVEIRFRATGDVETVFRLHSNEKTQEQLRRYVLQRLDGDELVALVRLPEAGLYAVNLYAAAKSHVRSLPNVCSYIINALRPAEDLTPFPDVPNGQIGPTDEMAKLKLKPNSHQSAFVRLPSGRSEVELVFTKQDATSAQLDFVTKLALHRSDTVTPSVDMVFIADSADRITFRVRLTRPGQHLLQIYGRRRSAAEPNAPKSSALPLIFTYVLVASRGRSPYGPVRPFPKQYGLWPAGAQLLDPPDYIGLIPASQKVTWFEVVLPRVTDVAVIGDGGQNWMRLDRVDEQGQVKNDEGTEDAGKWCGEVETKGEVGEEIQLAVRYDRNSTNFTTLLLFKVVADAEYDDVTSPH